MLGDTQGWLDAMIAKGHSPVLDDEFTIDLYVVDYAPHNGPGCSLCGESWCMWCWKADKIPQCKGKP